MIFITEDDHVHPRFLGQGDGRFLDASHQLPAMSEGNGVAVGDVTNTAWQTGLRKAEITDFRYHDPRHTWASWHRAAGTNCDELKDLGGWKSRAMVDRYAKFATEYLQSAATRIELERAENVPKLTRFCHSKRRTKVGRRC